MSAVEIISILLVQAILSFGAMAIILGLFIINYAQGRVKWFGVCQAVTGLLCICFILLTQLPASGPILDIGVGQVKVAEYALASFGMLVGIGIAVVLFLLLLMRK